MRYNSTITKTVKYATALQYSMMVLLSTGVPLNAQLTRCFNAILGQSDDFLSWLLVHADTIDPKLDFDTAAITETLETVAAAVSINNNGTGTGTRNGNIDSNDSNGSNDSNDSNRRDDDGDGAQEGETKAGEGGFTTTPFSPMIPPLQQQAQPLRTPTSRPDGNQPRVGGDLGGIFSTITEAVTTSEATSNTTSTAAPSLGLGLIDPPGPGVAPEPSLLALESTTISPARTDAGAWAGAVVGNPQASEGGHASEGGDVGRQGAEIMGTNGVVSDSVNSALQGQLIVGVGGIPLDPMLAMQMGARMALSGEILVSILACSARGMGGVFEPRSTLLLVCNWPKK